MTFDELLAQVLDLLQHQGRVSYGALKRRFDLDDAYLEDLKAEIIEAQYLAEEILTARSTMEGERKHVTVLFADIKGSTELIDGLDPEAAQQLLDPALQHMMAAVHRFEGTMNQVLGDGIMALFGAPIAHEDHALRACYAALAMQAALRAYAEEVRRTHGMPLQIRVGLNAGDVVVRAIGNDLHMDYSAVGQTTHLAARMEQLATPGSILLTAATHRLVEGLVRVQALGPVPVKGLAEPVEVYELVGVSGLRRRLQAAAGEAEAIRLAEPTQHAFTVALAHWAASTLHLLKGDWTKARSLVERWITVVRTGNVVLQLPLSVASSAWVLAQLGEASEALNRLQEGEQLLERLAARGLAGQIGWMYHLLGRAALLLGRLDEARRLGDRAVESSPRQPGFAAHALHLLGDIATHPDRFDAERGEAQYRKALALAEPRGMRPLVAHCHLGLGTLYARTGWPEPARAALTTAIDLYRAMDMTFWLPQAEAALAQVGEAEAPEREVH